MCCCPPSMTTSPTKTRRLTSSGTTNRVIRIPLQTSKISAKKIFLGHRFCPYHCAWCKNDAEVLACQDTRWLGQGSTVETVADERESPPALLPLRACLRYA